VQPGGLATDIKTLRENLLLSTVVAVTGIGMPICLSFVLQSLIQIDSLQAFGAGAALCSTSLGTTFTVLMTSGLIDSRLGVVLSSAAMMDDIVGLVMVQIISSLGTSRGSSVAPTIPRSILVSIAYAVLTPLICAYFVLPATKSVVDKMAKKDNTATSVFLTSKPAYFVYETLFLISMVISATYAGTSGLFAAYLSGAVASWHDTIVHRAGLLYQDSTHAGQPSQSVQRHSDKIQAPRPREDAVLPASQHVVDSQDELKGLSSSIYEEYYRKPVATVLKPFFFASIGFSIPITRMFECSIVWRGIVYTILMVFGKLLCGICLIRIANPFPRVTKALRRAKIFSLQTSCALSARRAKINDNGNVADNPTTSPLSSRSADCSASTSHELALVRQTDQPARQDEISGGKKSALSDKPLSLYPAALLGSAMIARGEIGFLISAVAQSSGIFNTDLFLIVTWAIFLCTFIGPILVGLLVGRVKRLQHKRTGSAGNKDPLGIWGIKSNSNA
jgi:Kef-type K+ transport system membrane component KefB